MLRSLLNQVPGVKAPGEICNASTAHVRSQSTSFFRFREHACVENRDFFYPTRDLQATLLDQFIGSIRQTMPDSTLVVLDIKYTHVHNFNASWWDMSLRPFLLDYAGMRRMGIIHLVREKVYQTAISQIYTRKTGVWRASRPEDTRKLRIAIDRTELEDRVRRLVHNVRAFDRWLAGTKHVRLAYEDLASDPRRSLHGLQDFLGLKNEIPKMSRYVKTTPPYEEAIANFAELRELVCVRISEIAEETLQRGK
jgi:hypothetical protein